MASNPLDYLTDFRSKLQDSMTEDQKKAASDKAFGQITQFQQVPTEYTGSAYTKMPQSVVSTTNSDRDVAERPSAPKDSGKSGADFVKYYADASNDNGGSKAFLDSYYAGAKQRGKDLKVVDEAAIDTGLERSIQDSYDKAYIQQVLTFGDMYNKDYKPPNYENTPPEEVEKPDFEELYDKVIGNFD